jgi:hypothetical protein
MIYWKKKMRENEMEPNKKRPSQKVTGAAESA